MLYHVVSLYFGRWVAPVAPWFSVIPGVTWSKSKQWLHLLRPYPDVFQLTNAKRMQSALSDVAARLWRPFPDQTALRKYGRGSKCHVYIGNYRDLGITNHLLIWLSVSVAFLSTLGIPYLSSVYLNHGITVRHFREKKDLQKKSNRSTSSEWLSGPGANMEMDSSQVTVFNGIWRMSGNQSKQATA